MRDLYSKTNAPYLIAGAFATLALLASGTLAVTPYVAFLSPIAAFNVALPVALSLSILSTLILALSCKMISNNKKIEVERNKFAEKEQELKQQLESKVQELENKIALGKEAASKEVEELNNQLNELTQENRGLEDEVKRLNEEIEWLEDPQEELYDKSEGKGEDENKNEELEKKITKEIENLEACLNITSKNVDLHKQKEKHSSENSNIDKALFDKSLKLEKKHNERLSNTEEMLNMLKQNLLQGKTVQETVNSLEIIKGLSSEHSPASRLYKKLNDASYDSGYTSRCSTPTNSYHTF